MSGGDYVSNLLGLASAATTQPGATPQYGLVYDLASNSYMNASQFRQFVRDVVPATQTQLKQQAKEAEERRLRSEELEKARNYQEHGLFMTSKNMGVGAHGVGNSIEASFKKIGNVLGQGVSFLAAGPGSDDTDDLYKEYAAKGGLLTEDQFREFDNGTQITLTNKASFHESLKDFADTPGIEQALGAISTAYRGLTAGFAFRAHNPGDLFEGDRWKKAWEEAQGESLGQAMLGSAIDPYVSDEQLDRMKRDNPWFQMAAVGSEFMVAWYADPLVVAGKGAGYAARFSKSELPMNPASQTAIGLRQTLAGEAVSSRNPFVRGNVALRRGNLLHQQQLVGDYARSGVGPAEFSRLPMYQSRSRAVDGGAASFAMHWAANNRATAAAIFQDPAIKQGMKELGEAHGAPAPTNLDVERLTWGLQFSDARSWAIVDKLRNISPAELNKFAPGSQTLLDSLDAMTTKASSLTDEVADLSKQMDEINGGLDTSRLDGKATTRFHQWEVHTDLVDRQRQLNEVSEMLHKYEGYGQWLDLTSKPSSISRVKAPPKDRWSDRRFPARGEEGETRSIFQDNRFGAAHSYNKITRGLFIQRAGTASFHDLDSGLQSINRQFDQYEHLFDYAPAGAREDFVTRYVAAGRDPYKQYKIMHDLEEEHLVAGLSHKLGLDPEVTRAVVNKINDKRNESIRGILTGDNAVYRSAPTMMQRLGREDATLSLVERGEDGFVKLALMNGRHKQTFEVPEEALWERVAPEDVTQTPNYYNPLDTRRLYHQMKHHQDVLSELNANYLAHGKGALLDAGEKFANWFYGMWKPAQLFRLGWPARVLMDEGARAMAVVGPMYWLTGPGMEGVYHSARNIIPATADAVSRRRHGKLGTDLGPGPVATAAKQAPNQFARETEVAEAVQVPESLWPKINQDRADKVAGHVEANRAWREQYNRSMYWHNEVVKRLSTDEPMTATQTKLMRYGTRQTQKSPEVPYHPIQRAYDHFASNTLEGRSRLYDPVTGSQITKGYAVPIGIAPARQREAGMWYEANAEMLSRQGMRLYIGTDGQVTVARHFRSNQSAKARAFTEYVAEKHPDVEMVDLSKGTTYKVQDWNDFTRIEEQTRRYFASEPEKDFVPGESPIEGVDAEPVYHGADRELPDELLPRDDVPVYNGRMVGSGLYTTVSRQTAETYAYRDPSRVYTIRGSRSGRQYKVFDLDKPIAPYEDDLLDWLRDPRGGDAPIDVIEEIEYVTGGWRVSAYATASNPEGVTWANVYEHLAGNTHAGTEAQRYLHMYLEEKHNAGALTHLGGASHQHPHQVYVWLHPEDLEVKPAWANTGKYHNLPEWFSHPQSTESVMPESRIIRKGIRNPMVRELRTISNKLENDFDNLTGSQIDELVQREKGLMEALGLRRRNNGVTNRADKHSQLLPDRYVVDRPDHFERMVKEARDEDTARTMAQQANGELRAREVESQDFGDIGDFDFQIDSPVSWLFNKIRERHEQGAKYKTWTSSDGVKFETEGAFSGHRGQLFRSLVGSSKTLDVLSEGHGHGTSLFRRKSEGYRVYNPPQFSERAVKNHRSAEHKKAVRYFQNYADMVNDHLGHSPIVSRMLNGESDDSIIEWLDNTAEGALIRKQVKPESMPTGVWVDDARYKLNYYVPSRKLQRLLAKGRLRPSDFRREVADEDLPSVYGPDLEVLDRRRSFPEFASDFADRMWSGLGGVPIDRLSRHPFAQAMYNQKMQSLIAQNKSKWLSDDVIQDMAAQSQAHAMNEVKRTLFTLTEGTNFNDALRFVAPFWNAQYEAITKWLRIISDRPETLPRFYGGMRAVYNNFVTVDEDGKPTNRTGGYHPTDRVILQMPGFLQRKLFPDFVPAKLNPSLEHMGAVGIPIGSANTVLQGELPLLPGFGPLVTIPADQFMRKVSKTYMVEHDNDLLYRWLFPVGRPRSKNTFGQMMEQLSPGWGKRVMQASSAEDDQARINMEVQLGREMLLKARRDGKPEPTDEEISKAADHMWATRILSGLVQPFQTQYLPQHQYWVDALHSMQKQYGPEAWDKFVDKYGEEAAIYATSASNSVGVPPTAKGMAEWKASQKLIAKYPKWASAIISPDAYKDDFSPDAYGQQFNITLGPGQTEALRSGTSLQDRLYNDPESRLGWREFRKLSAAIEAELFARGLTNIQQSGAEDIQQVKRANVADLMQKYPAWARQYQTQTQEIYSDVEELKYISSQKAFAKRPDMQGVRQYLQIRQQVVELLDDYGTKGGSRSLQSQENGALRDWFYGQVGQLVLDNPAFAEFYSRYLDNDDLSQGGGGF